MRKVEYDYEPEAWEFVEENGKRTDIIAEPEKLTNREFVNFLRKDKVLTEEEALYTAGCEYSK